MPGRRAGDTKVGRRTAVKVALAGAAATTAWALWPKGKKTKKQAARDKKQTAERQRISAEARRQFVETKRLSKELKDLDIGTRLGPRKQLGLAKICVRFNWEPKSNLKHRNMISLIERVSLNSGMRAGDILYHAARSKLSLVEMRELYNLRVIKRPKLMRQIREARKNKKSTKALDKKLNELNEGILERQITSAISDACISEEAFNNRPGERDTHPSIQDFRATLSKYANTPTKQNALKGL